MSPAWIGFLRGLGMVALTAVLSFVGDQANLAFLDPKIALLLSGIALTIEGVIEKSTGKQLFGAATPAPRV